MDEFKNTGIKFCIFNNNNIKLSCYNSYLSCGGNFGLNQMSFCHLSPNSLSTVAPQHVAAPRLMMKIMMTGQEKQIKGVQLPVKKCKMRVVEIVAYMWASEWLFANNWCDPSFLLSLSLMRANVTESVPITDVPPGTPTPLPCSTHSNAICHLPPPFLASWGSQKKEYGFALHVLSLLILEVHDQKEIKWNSSNTRKMENTQI